MHNKTFDSALDCYWNGDVSQLSAMAEDTFTATITSQESVTLKLSGDGSICWQESNCSCGQGPLCQHILAAFLALQKEQALPGSPD